MFEYDKIVVGSCMSAVLFAFNNNYPIFFTTPFRPFRFSYFDSTVNFDRLKIISTVKSLTTLGEEKLIGAPKELLWERLLFLIIYGALLIAIIGVQMVLFLLQWVWQLFQTTTPPFLTLKCHQLNLLAYDIMQYLSKNSDQKPGPF